MMTDTTTPLSADDEAALDRYARSIASALGAIAPSTDKSSVVNWPLDHGEEDKGGAVELARCAHVGGASAPLIDPATLAAGWHAAACGACGCASEPWLCLHCGATHCGRYQRRHALAHHRAARADGRRGDRAREGRAGRPLP